MDTGPNAGARKNARRNPNSDDIDHFHDQTVWERDMRAIMTSALSSRTDEATRECLELS